MRACDRWIANDYLARSGQPLEPSCDHDPADCPPHHQEPPMTTAEPAVCGHRWPGHCPGRTGHTCAAAAGAHLTDRHRCLCGATAPEDTWEQTATTDQLCDEYGEGDT